MAQYNYPKAEISIHAVFRKAGLTVSQFHRTRLRGYQVRTNGVYAEREGRFYRENGNFPHYQIKFENYEHRKDDVINALRDAGYHLFDGSQIKIAKHYDRNATAICVASFPCEYPELTFAQP